MLCVRKHAVGGGEVLQVTLTFALFLNGPPLSLDCLETPL